MSFTQGWYTRQYGKHLQHMLEQLRRRQARIPARAMANDLWTGKKQALSELTQIERAVCSRVRTYKNGVQLYFHGSGRAH